MSEHEEQSKGFKVTDRRSFTADGSRRSDTEEAEEAAIPETMPPPTSARAVGERSAEGRNEAGFVDLLSLLATQASLALGEPNPVTGESHRDLQGARILISMIEVLADKTKGNLTREEASALESTLYALRMGFVTKSNVNKS